MSDDIMERRVQFRSNSFVLTIPPKIISDMKISKGQSVRFIQGEGEFTIRPTQVDTSKTGASNPDKYAKVISDAINERHDTQDKPAKHEKASKLEKLRLK